MQHMSIHPVTTENIRDACTLLGGAFRQVARAATTILRSELTFFFGNTARSLEEYIGAEYGAAQDVLNKRAEAKAERGFIRKERVKHLPKTPEYMGECTLLDRFPEGFPVQTIQSTAETQIGGIQRQAIIEAAGRMTP